MKKPDAMQTYISDKTIHCVRRKLNWLEKFGWRIDHYLVGGQDGIIIILTHNVSLAEPRIKTVKRVRLDDMLDWQSMVDRLKSKGWRFLSFQTNSLPKFPFRFRWLIEKAA